MKSAQANLHFRWTSLKVQLWQLCSRKKGAESVGVYLPPFLLDDMPITFSKFGCKETSFNVLLVKAGIDYQQTPLLFDTSDAKEETNLYET